MQLAVCMFDNDTRRTRQQRHGRYFPGAEFAHHLHFQRIPYAQYPLRIRTDQVVIVEPCQATDGLAVAIQHGQVVSIRDGPDPDIALLTAAGQPVALRTEGNTFCTKQVDFLETQLRTL
jgi:hypothetical protein